jgi:hypothetical protein
MELRDLAERILFASTLEEKRARPEIITDERPGATMESPRGTGPTLGSVPLAMRRKQSDCEAPL